MYEWKRFWARRGAQVNLGDDGYLVDPDAEYGSLFNPHAAPVDFSISTQCLVLLGEPGIGKSFTMEAARQAVSQHITAAGDSVIWLDLHEIGSDHQLYRKLFDKPSFRQWQDGSGKLYLFLDSFDECRVRISSLPALILSELKELDISRLSLRIASRTADWSTSLEAGLQQLFGSDNVEILELLPLRKADVQFAAQQAGVADTNAFLAAIADSEVVPLAIKPTTLAFVVNSFQRYGSLPARQSDLYRDGCRLLCEETERRLEVGLQPSFNAQQRVAVACRIAAMTMFGNRAAVWTAVDRGNVPDDDVTIDALAGDVEFENGSAFAIDAAAIREALDSGLFSSRGADRLGLAHQTYGEFLAADYLVRRELALPQIMSLIVHADDPEGKIVPQLHATAAWLASLRSDIFAEIMQRDPEVLLRSDVASATNGDRKSLVDSLLQGYDSGKLLDDERGQRRYYAHLNHPSLAAQLRPFILDCGKGLVVRRVAIDIAEQCQLTELLDDLVGVALDPEEPHRVRVNAAYAVIRIGEPHSRGKLKPLVSIDPRADPDDQLKGCGLQATWPDLLTGSELIAALTPVRGHLVGAYRHFLFRDPATKILPADLALALRWAREQITSHEVLVEFQPLVSNILRRAWEHLDDPGVLAEYAQTVLLRARQFESVLEELGTEHTDEVLLPRERRLRVIEAALPFAEDVRDLRLLAWNGLVHPQDMPWVLERLAAADASSKRGWAELAVAVMDLRDHALVEQVLEAREADETLWDVTAPWFDAIPLDSPQARQARKLHEMDLEREARRNQKPPSLDPPPAERIRNDLDRFATGDLDAWWRLNFDLILENTENQQIYEFESDLTALPGWREADSATKLEVLEAAEQYLLHQVPKPDAWISDYPKITIYRPD